MAEQRFASLDSVRGIAALVVLLNHVFNFVDGSNWDSPWLRYTPLGLFVNGRIAVIVFFVLSGFVLSASIASARQFSHGTFVVKRILRIYLPFLAALVIAAVTASLLAFPVPPWRAEASDWVHPVAGILLSHILMLGNGYPNISLNPPMWTLIQEIRIALIFPLIYFAVTRFGSRAFLATLVLSLAASKLEMITGIPFDDKVPATAVGSIALNIYYSMFFALGSLLYMRRQEIAAVAQRFDCRVAIVFALALLLVPRCLPDISFILGDIFYGVVAATVIVVSFSFGQNIPVLNTPLARFLGKISFSLYLIHVPQLLTADIVLEPYMASVYRVVIGGVVSIPIAIAFFYLFERPAHLLSRLGGQRSARKIA
ncbi:acyltransferase family protein [Rhizobium binxianense]